MVSSLRSQQLFQTIIFIVVVRHDNFPSFRPHHVKDVRITEFNSILDSFYRETNLTRIKRGSIFDPTYICTDTYTRTHFSEFRFDCETVLKLFETKHHTHTPHTPYTVDEYCRTKY